MINRYFETIEQLDNAVSERCLRSVLRCSVSEKLRNDNRLWVA